MKRILSALFLFAGFTAIAQNTQYESFKQDAELEAAFRTKDMSRFVEEPVSFIYDTLEITVNITKLNDLLKTYATAPKNTQVRKASETNNGYVQTFGIYKDDDALKYVRFTMSQLTGKLEEVVIENND